MAYTCQQLALKVNNMKNYLLTIVTSTAIANSAMAGISMYNPNTGATEDITNRKASVIQQRASRTYSREETQNKYQLTPSQAERIKRAARKSQLQLEPESYSAKNPYGKLITFMRPGEPYNMFTLATLGTLSQIPDVANEVYYKDEPRSAMMKRIENAEELAKRIRSNQKASEEDIKRLSESVNNVPAGNTDASNKLGKRYGVTKYPTVIYIAPNGKSKKYDFSNADGGKHLAKDILKHIKKAKSLSQNQ